MSDFMLSLENVTTRRGKTLLLEHIDLKIHAGDHWGILGNNGSGKTCLLKLLAGQLPVTSGHYHLSVASKEIALLTSDYHFKNLSGINDFFHQQRFNATMSDDAPTVNRLLTEAAQKAPSGHWTVEHVVELLALTPLLSEEVIKLSNGETKRLRLGTLLLHQPKILLLDTPLVGLDVHTRKTFDRIFQKIAASGITLIMTLEPQEIPEIVTHALVLENHRISSTHSKDAFYNIHLTEPQKTPFDSRLLSDMLSKAIPAFETIIDMKDVNIRYGDRQVLSHVQWHVKQGERWTLCGPNGAGKSTLLSLINGDNPQAYANDIVLFDRKKGTGETIWDIKRKIGFVSPELLHYFRTQQSCLQVILSGLREGPDPLPITGPLTEQALNWMTLFGIADQQEVRFKSSAPTTQRLTLLARALIKNPALLVLDEPCQGLDQTQTQKIQRIIDHICAHSKLTLIYVTHYQQELPACIDHTMELKEGKRIL